MQQSNEENAVGILLAAEREGERYGLCLLTGGEQKTLTPAIFKTPEFAREFLDSGDIAELMVKGVGLKAVTVAPDSLVQWAVDTRGPNFRPKAITAASQPNFVFLRIDIPEENWAGAPQVGISARNLN